VATANHTHQFPHTGENLMKLFPIALTALLAIIVVAVTRPAPHAPRSHAIKESLINPVTVAVSVTPGQLVPLDTATIAATFSTAGPKSGPYTATLELRPSAGDPGPTGTQGGFRLHRNQPLTVYWEWRAGAALPPGVYTVRVRLRDVAGHTVASGTAPAPLIVAGRS
jgi:hypothetical protein